MRWIWAGFPVVLLLMVGCTTAKLMMMIDPVLEENAQVYEVSSPGRFTDARLNVSFGDYRVAEADARSMATRDPSAPDSLWLRMLFGILHLDTSSNSDSKRNEVFTSHTYQFKIGDEMTWDAKCHFLAEEHEVRDVNDAIITNQPEVTVRVETLSSHYKCRYTASDHEPWVLTIEQWRGESDPDIKMDIKMTNDGQHLAAYLTAGEYVAADGRNVWGHPADTGYTWMQDDKNIGAVAVGEKIPRVWLHKDNSRPTDDILSMASAGLLIYHKEIVPTLKK